MKKQTIKAVIAISILLLTIAAFVVYLAKNPDILQQLSDTSILILALLLVLYGIFMWSLILVQRGTLALCSIYLDAKESRLLMMYSSIINFFGPLQSGPAFRAAYLKTKHNLNLKSYAAATLVYYISYAVISILLILMYVLGLWSVVAGVIFVLAIFVLKNNSSIKKLLPSKLQVLALKGTIQVVIATLIQLITITVIYYVQLRSLDNSISPFQVLAYSGAANLALFVSITPGAIGFRESFLLLSQDIHGIGTDIVVAASVLDRSVYISMLLLLSLYVFGTHAQNFLKYKK